MKAATAAKAENSEFRDHQGLPRVSFTGTFAQPTGDVQRVVTSVDS